MPKCSLAIKAMFVCFIYINKFYPQTALLHRYFYYHCPVFSSLRKLPQRDSYNLSYHLSHYRRGRESAGLNHCVRLLAVSSLSTSVTSNKPGHLGKVDFFFFNSSAFKMCFICLLVSTQISPSL